MGRIEPTNPGGEGKLRPHRTQALTWPIGVAVLVVLGAAFLSGTWWMYRVSEDSVVRTRVSHAEAVADNLSSTIEPLLNSGELSAVRRSLSEAALRNGFESCQLSLADGRPLVDADLSRPQLTVIPATWPGEGLSEPTTRLINGQVHVTRPVPVVGKGGATLAISMSVVNETQVFRQALPGLGVLGGLSLIFSLLVYRKVSRRLGPLSMIQNALMDVNHGESAIQAMRLDERYGREAKGWNTLLVDRMRSDEQAVDEQLDALGTRSGVGGVLEHGCDVLWQGLVVIDARGEVVYANGAACAALGVARDEAVGVAMASIFEDERVTQCVENALAGKGAARTSIEWKRDMENGPSYLRQTIRPISGEECAGVIVLLEDVTQQHIAESGRHDFIAQATHELRAPLTNIQLYLETAQDEGDGDPKLRGECLNVIARETQRLNRLVGEMLSVSEIEAGAMALKKDDIRLDSLFGDLQGDYAALAAEKQITMEFDLPPKMPVIQGDREKLAVVVQNLLGNAIKYTPEGGEVRVFVEMSERELTLEVSDSGIGISEEDVEKVFEKFYRANDPRVGDITGSGLGLALTSEIVRLHGGDLTVESELNEGSTFKMTLPIRVEGM